MFSMANSTEDVTKDLVAHRARTAIKEIRNYLAGRALGFTRDESLLEEVLKIIFSYIYIKLYNSSIIINVHELNTEEIAKIYRKQFTFVIKKYPSIFDKNEQILLAPKEILFIHNKLNEIEWIEQGYDLIRDVYEVFLGSQYRGQEGQFFTPEVAVGALVELVEPQKDDTIIDPACGSGSFLIAAAKKLSQAAWGKAESPLRICAIDKDKFLARLARIHLGLLLGKNIPVLSIDSLSPGALLKTECGTEKFSIILTNPPFGSKIQAVDEEHKAKYNLAYKWKKDKKTGRYIKTNELQKNVPPQVFFVEKIISLLEDGGRAGVILPESLLSSPKYRYVVQYILDHSQPLAVIGMPEELFKTSGRGGTHTKTVMLVIQKKKIDEDSEIFMAEAKWCGHDSRGRSIPKNDIPRIITNYQAYKKGNLTQESHLGFIIKTKDIQDNILVPKMYSGYIQIKKINNGNKVISIGELVEEGILTIDTGDEVGKLAYGSGDVPFIRTSDISNWEIKVDPKHMVSNDIYERLAEKQDVQEGDILMVKDGTYLIGSVAYITKHDTRIIYQSHLYKIRLYQNEYFDRYYLLAALSSPFVREQIRAFSFTQDIINSLGKRILDIRLPIPKTRVEMTKISNYVRQSIELRVRARELASKAKEIVANS